MPHEHEHQHRQQHGQRRGRGRGRDPDGGSGHGHRHDGDPALVLDAAALDAVLFDMDGVVTDTAGLHADAWKETFDAFVRDRRERSRDPAGGDGGDGEDLRPFDPERDYRRLVDGRPRLDGIRAFLDARRIVLDEGKPGDGPDRRTVHGLGAAKQERFLARLHEAGVSTFDDAVGLVRALRDAGRRVGVFSASRNAGRVLARAGLDVLFDARVDGTLAAELGLPGKPDPAMLLETARRLRAEPTRCAVVEDAVAGVEAGRRGRFARVLGLARDGRTRRLEEAGADVVVSSLAHVSILTREGGAARARPDRGAPL
jgi:alpha,alpha-trehalase